MVHGDASRIAGDDRRALNRNCNKGNQMVSMLKRVDRVQIAVPESAPPSAW